METLLNYDGNIMAKKYFEEEDFKDKRRADRRARNKKKHDKSKNFMKDKGFVDGYSEEDIEQIVLRHSDNMRKCSCSLCKNWNKYYGVPTIQEQKAIDQQKFDIENKEGSEDEE